MESLTDTLNYLSWPAKAVNALRAVLADLNVPLPAVAAQGLVLAIMVFMTVYLVQGARGGENRLIRLAQAVGSLATMAAVIAIAYAWVDALVVPPSHQLLGIVVGVPVDSVRIELVDYRGVPVSATVDRDRGSGRFLISYTPEFADPPSAVVVAASRCRDEQKIPLRRPQLKRGVAIHVHLACGDSG